MKIKTILFFVLTVFGINCQAQFKNIEECLQDMPKILMPSLSSPLRAELLDNYDNKGVDTIQNLFGTSSKLLHLDKKHQYVSIQVTSNTRLDMMLFVQNQDTIVGVINTVCAPICSSYIHFYDKKWNILPTTLPTIENEYWFKSQDKSFDGVKIGDMFKTDFFEYSFNAQDQTIEVKNNSLEYLGLEEQKAVQPYFEDKVIVLKRNEKGRWIR